MITILQQRTLKYGLREWLKIKSTLGRDQQLDTYYFGYGANLSLERFKKWHIPVEAVGAAYIDEHQLKFNLPCEYKGKGFAGIENVPGKRVWGILFKINSSALKMLDVLEWVPFNFYDRKLFEVVSNDKQYQNVHTYVTCHPRYDLIPSKAYLDFIIQAGRKADFPEEYLSELSTHPSATTFELDPSFVLRNPARKRVLSHKLSEVYLAHDRLREKLSRLIP
jgi:gamma-glutamylcyclotransferase (GGCT)/AIG2-like uncharacterized protein YtfP